MSLNKYAFNIDLGEGFSETLSDLIWDDDAGPFENIFRWADRILILSGGGKAIVLGVLYTLDIGLHDIGAMIDRNLGLVHLSDVTSVDASDVGKGIADTLWAKIEGGETTAAFADDKIFVFAAYSNEQKLKLLQEFDKAGTNKAAFARDKGIPVSTFKDWLSARAAGRLAPTKKKLKMSPVDKKPAKKAPAKKKAPVKKKAPAKKPAPKATPAKEVPAKPKGLTPWQQEQKQQKEEDRKLRRELAKEERDRKEKERKDKAKAEQNRKDEADRKEQARKDEADRKERARKDEADRNQREADAERQRKEDERRSKEEKAEKDRAKKDKSDRKEQKRRDKVEDRRIKQQQKTMLQAEKLRAKGRKPSLHGLRRLGGKAALGTALVGLIGGTVKLATNPKSWLSRALRAAGIIGAETIQKAPKGTSETRERAAPSKPDDGLNEAEQVIEQIFSS